MRAHLFALAALAAIAVQVRAQDADRGKTLHDTYCVICHDSRVYTRENRIARDYREIRAQVKRWQQNASLKWDDADIDRAAAHLASRYYGLDCPTRY